MVEAARIAYRDYPTSVNEVPESGVVYNNTKADYARMDSVLQGAQKAIGGSSDSAQLALSYYWTEIYGDNDPDIVKQLYENVVILAQVAQISIDSTKRVYAVDPNEDIARIRSQSCMKRTKDYPKFMLYTHEIPVTKNGNFRPQDEISKDKKKLRKRIDDNLVCPMNWMEESLNQIQGLRNEAEWYPIQDLFIWMPGNANKYHVNKLRKLIEDYDKWIRRNLHNLMYFEDSDFEVYYQKQLEIIDAIHNVKPSAITINHLIASVLQVESKDVNNKTKYIKATKLQRKILSLLYKHNKDKFLSCFKKCPKSH